MDTFRACLKIKIAQNRYFFPFNGRKGRMFVMLKRYELADDEWKCIADLFLPENTGKRCRSRKDNRMIFNSIVLDFT